MSVTGRPTPAQLAETLGVELDPDILVLALTHRSFAHEAGGIPTNERLEFLGDSVLGLVVTDDLTLPAANSSKLRVIHASPDAPNVDVFVGGNRVLANVPFRAASEYLTVPVGGYGVEVRVAGKALADAGENERVTVENLSSRRVVQGIVGAAGDVWVSR